MKSTNNKTKFDGNSSNYSDYYWSKRRSSKRKWRKKRNNRTKGSIRYDVTLNGKMMPYIEQPPNKWRRQDSSRISWYEDDVQILRTRESIKQHMKNSTQYNGNKVICGSPEEMRQTNVYLFDSNWGKQNQFSVFWRDHDCKKYRKYRKLSKESYEDVVIESKQSHHARRKFLREKNMH